MFIFWGTPWTSVHISWGTACDHRYSLRSWARSGLCSHFPTRSCPAEAMQSKLSRSHPLCGKTHMEFCCKRKKENWHLKVQPRSAVAECMDSELLVIRPYGTQQGKQVCVIVIYPGVILERLLQCQGLVVGFINTWNSSEKNIFSFLLCLFVRLFVAK